MIAVVEWQLHVWLSCMCSIDTCSSVVSSSIGTFADTMTCMQILYTSLNVRFLTLHPKSKGPPKAESTQMILEKVQTICPRHREYLVLTDGMSTQAKAWSKIDTTSVELC